MNFKNQVNSIIVFFEKKLKLDLNFLLKGSFWLTLSNVFLGLTSILTTWFLTNYLSKEDFGFFQFFLSILGIVGIVSLNGLKSSLIISISKGYDGTFKFLIKKKLLFSLLGSIALFLISIYFYFFKGRYWEYFIIAAIVYPLLVSFNDVSSFFNGKEKFNELFKLNFYRKLFLWIPIIVFLIYFKSLFITIFLYVFLSVIYGLFSYYKSLTFTNNKKIDKTSFPYGLKLSLIQFPLTFVQYVDKIIVGYYLGLAQLANYALILLFGTLVENASSFIKILFLPKMSKMSNILVFNLIKSKLLILFLLNLILVSSGIVLIPYLIKYFFNDYSSIIFYVQLYLASLSFTFIISVISSFILSQQKIKILTFINIFLSSIRLFLFLFLIPLYGILGAVLTFLIINLIRILMYLIIFFKYMNPNKQAN